MIETSTSEVLSPPSNHPAAEYIRDLFKPDDHVCVTVIDQKSRTENGGQCQTVNRVMTVPDLTSKETIGDLEALNADGWSVFACLQPIKPGSTSRTKQDIVEAVRAFLDFDENAAAAYEKILTSSLVPEPHWVLESSPGKLQLVWHIEPMPAAELESLLDAMIQEFGADPACSDVSRVLRLPGFRNCKYPAHPLVQLKESPFDASPYPLSAFKLLAARKQSSAQINPGSVDPEQPILSGGRNDSLASLAGSMRNKGFSPAAIEAALQTINLERCQPPLDQDEVHTIAYSIGRYEVKPTPPCIIGGQRIDAAGLKAAPTGTAPAKPRFALPQVMGTHRDYVVAPVVGQTDSWFPRGDVSVIGGSSGANKSTLMFDLLDTQSRGEKFLGHSTFRLPYLILTADRGGNAQRRTLERMGLAEKNIPIARLKAVVGTAAVEEIQKAIEAAEVFPAVVFIEGGDMLVEDAAKLHFVVPFMEGLQELARYYHLAVILSVGAPKAKAGEGYTAKRDNLFGSVAWGRMSETIALLQFPGGEDTTFKRELSVLLRNGPAEIFKMVLENGKLIVEPQGQHEPQEITWFKARAVEGQSTPDKKWFTVGDLARALQISRPSAFRRIQEALAHSHIVTKPGRKQGQGGATMYRWNDSATNPLVSNCDGEGLEEQPSTEPGGTLFTAA